MQDSQTHFVLLIDRDRDHVLNIAFQALFNDDAALQYILKHNLSDTLQSLGIEIADKVHNLDWCTDQKCERKQ